MWFVEVSVRWDDKEIYKQHQQEDVKTASQKETTSDYKTEGHQQVSSLTWTDIKGNRMVILCATIHNTIHLSPSGIYMNNKRT